MCPFFVTCCIPWGADFLRGRQSSVCSSVGALGWTPLEGRKGSKIGSGGKLMWNAGLNNSLSWPHRELKLKWPLNSWTFRSPTLSISRLMWITLERAWAVSLSMWSFYSSGDPWSAHRSRGLSSDSYCSWSNKSFLKVDLGSVSLHPRHSLRMVKLTGNEKKKKKKLQ